MFNFNLVFISFLFINFISIINTVKSDECNKIVIEGGEQALRKLFDDFNEIKTIVKDLKSKYEEILEVNETKYKDSSIFDLRVDAMPKKCLTETLPKDCDEATSCTHRSGFYKIQIPSNNEPPFYVECDAKTEDGGWIIIQRRQDGSVDFYRDWSDYQAGFGDLDGEFFIGLDKLYALTNNNGPQELLIVMEDVNMKTAYAKYDAFAIANAADMYKLKKLGRFSGTAGDSLQQHVGFKFTTKDRDYDNDKANCAVTFRGAWWHNACHVR